MTSIKPFFHLKNYKDGISDALLNKSMDATPRSPEYEQGYAFGRIHYLNLCFTEPLTDGEVLDLVYDWVKKWDGNTNGKSTALLELKQILQEHEE